MKINPAQLLFPVLLLFFSTNVGASCNKNNAMSGYWTFTLQGSAIVDDFGGYLKYSANNDAQINMQGKLQFNKSSTLTSGIASDLGDILVHGLGLEDFDDDDYQGMVYDKRSRLDGTRYNKWTKDRNKCVTSAIRVGFRGKDTIDGRAYNKTYCVLTSSLAKNRHTALLAGYCVQSRLINGTVREMFAPVNGKMQQRRTYAD
jgi:hypothetical protein